MLGHSGSWGHWGGKQAAFCDGNALTYLPNEIFLSSGQVTIWVHQPGRHPEGHSTVPSTEGATQLPLHSTDPSSGVTGASTQWLLYRANPETRICSQNETGWTPGHRNSQNVPRIHTRTVFQKHLDLFCMKTTDKGIPEVLWSWGGQAVVGVQPEPGLAPALFWWAHPLGRGPRERSLQSPQAYVTGDLGSSHPKGLVAISHPHLGCSPLTVRPLLMSVRPLLTSLSHSSGRAHIWWLFQKRCRFRRWRKDCHILHTDMIKLTIFWGSGWQVLLWIRDMGGWRNKVKRPSNLASIS